MARGGSKSGRRASRNRGGGGGSQLLSIRRPISPSLATTNLALSGLVAAGGVWPMDSLLEHRALEQQEAVAEEETAENIAEPDEDSGHMEVDGTGGSGTTVRERMHLHWREMSGRVVIPDVWGHEEWLQEWVGTDLVEDALRPPGLLSARDAMINDCQAAEHLTVAATASHSPSSSTSSRGSGLHSNSMRIDVKAR